MRYLYILLSLLIISCSNETETTKNEKDPISSESQEEQEKPAIENDFQPIISQEYGKVFSCRIGLYQQQCVMILYFDRNSEGDDYNARVTGEYFYSKYQKKLDLEGSFENESSWVSMTESYKGKTSGVMGFSIAHDAKDAFWAVSDNDRHQDMHASLLFDFDPTTEKVEIKHEKFAAEHAVDYNPEYEEPKTATNSLNVSWIGDHFLAFDYHVVNFSQNLGSVDGIAEVNEDGTAVWEDENGFRLTFKFENDQAVVESENYEEMTYGGFGVTFGGTYPKI